MLMVFGGYVLYTLEYMTVIFQRALSCGIYFGRLNLCPLNLNLTKLGGLIEGSQLDTVSYTLLAHRETILLYHKPHEMNYFSKLKGS